MQAVNNIIDVFVNKHPNVSLSQLCVLNGLSRNYITNLRSKKVVGKKAMATLNYLIYLGNKHPDRYKRKEWIWDKNIRIN